MTFFRKKNKISLLIIVISIFAILSVAPYFMGPGLTQAEPISNYLNNAFPETISTPEALYEPVFPNLTFDSPLTFKEVANNRIILGQRDGQIFWFDKDPNVLVKTTILDLTDEVGVVWDGGFLGLAVHPQFGTPNKNFIYTWYSSKDVNGNDFPNTPGGQACYTSSDNGNFMYLSRFELNPVDLSYVENSQTTMIKVDMYGTTHRGGGMDFGDDGFLYLSTGDQARWSQSQDIINNLHGGVLRIDVDKDPTKSHPPIRKMPQDIGNTDEATGLEYWIPNDNPFLSPTGDRFEEYYTLGNRNPHRMTKDRETGIFYIGEIGGNRHEEINVVMPGKNYGWPKFEGYGPGDCTEVDLYNNMTHEPPLVEFPRAEANSIIGGYVYRGSEVPELYGKYICADYGVGEEIWSVNISDGSYEQLGVFGSSDIISFGEDAQGELYILKYGESTLFKLQSTTNVNLDNVPQFLSQTGAFQNLSTLQPSSGVIAYDLVESFWSDGALKKRWLAVPNDGTHDTAAEQIIYSENDVWQFPIGSVLIKHFELPINENNPNETKRLETRFSVKGSDGNFYFLTYKWNAQQTDAELLETGLDEDVQITTADGSTENQTWNYPSMSDCSSCHNNASGGTLGTRTRYLNKDFTYDQTGLTANQLVTFSHLGILDQNITDVDTPDFLTHKSITDPNASLDEKARSYLDLNCAYCHRPDTGNRGNFDLRSRLDIFQTGLYTALPNQSLGIPGEGILSPGDASKSILYLRANGINSSIAMPPLSKNKIDENGVDLIEEWINQLDPNFEDPTITACTYILTNVGSGLVMDIFGASQVNGADVIQWTDLAGANQQFIVEPDGNNYYTLKAVHSNKNIDIDNQGQVPGTNVIQYGENGTDAQLFSFEYLGNGQYAIKSKANDLYLGIENNSLIDGGSIKTYINDGTDFFKWTFTGLTPVTGVTVLEESETILTGESVSLTASILPNNACEQNVIWSSSDETIAIVDTSGNVTGISDGIVTITATTVEGAFTDTAQITVIEIDCNGTIVDHTDPVGTGTIIARAEINQAENRFKAFDNKKTQSDHSKWLDNAGVPSVVDPSYISIEFDSPKWVNKMVITSANDDYGRDPENFRILGSNGGSFTELANWAGVEFANRYESKDFIFVNDTAYKTYRLEITKNDDDINLTQLAEIELIGCDVIPGITYTYNNSWSPSDPNNIANLNDEIMIEAGEAVISMNTVSKNISVDPGAALRVNAGITLTANTTTLNSTSLLYSSLIVDGTIEGTVKYVRYVNANSGGNDLISPPLSGETWANFLLSDTNATDILNDGNDNPRTYLFGPFDKATDWYVNYTDEVTTTLNSGTGYRAATVSGTTLTFTGTVLKTPVTVDIINSGTIYPDWNLIGNPYPSYISIADFLNHETAPTIKNIDLLEDISGIYGYDGNASNGWDVITLANAGNRLMAPGQGFLVAADVAHVDDYNITFDTSMRTTGSDDDFIAGRDSSVLTFLKLNASTSNNDYTTEFYFNANASQGLDAGYDGKILGNVAPNFAIYSHLVQDNTGLPIALQALNPSDLANTIIPLGVNSNQGEQITFSISETTLPSNVEVYLEDNVANTLTLLNTGDYTFTPNVNLNGTDRFYLRISSTVLSFGQNELDDLRIYTTVNPKSLVIKGELNAATEVNLYDIRGRLVLNKALNQLSLSNTIDISEIGSGIYIAKVFNDTQIKTQKLVIK